MSSSITSFITPSPLHYDIYAQPTFDPRSTNKQRVWKESKRRAATYRKRSVAKQADCSEGVQMSIEAKPSPSPHQTITKPSCSLGTKMLPF